MDGGNLFDSLYFYDNLFFDQQVYTVSRFQFHLLVADRQGDLPLYIKPLFNQVKLQAGFVNGFEQAWPQGTVNIN